MGTTERRERERQQRREQILGAARTLFRENGYERATMPMIAAAAELAPGTLYLYFRSKQALYAELLQEGYDILERRLREAVAAAPTPRARAAALVDAFIAFASAFPATFDIVFFILQEPGREMAELRDGRELMGRLAARQDACKRIAAEVLRGARPHLAAGEVERQVDAVWSMLAGVVLYFLHDQPETFAAVAATARELILRGVFGGE
jgi:AcrR family transcriptional regulator